MLYEQYSRLDFSYPQDRPIAIRGLEERLANAFGTIGAHGIFNAYFQRSLLWHRGTNVASLTPITADPQHPEREWHSPTWSWMSYYGGIDFMRPEPGMSWDRDFVWELQSEARMTIRGLARKLVAVEVADIARLAIVLDAGDQTSVEGLLYVVVGQVTRVVGSGPNTYVLAVRRKKNAVMYERVGAGFLPESMLEKNRVNVLIQ